MPRTLLEQYPLFQYNDPTPRIGEKKGASPSVDPVNVPRPLFQDQNRSNELKMAAFWARAFHKKLGVQSPCWSDSDQNVQCHSLKDVG